MKEQIRSWTAAAALAAFAWTTLAMPSPARPASAIAGKNVPACSIASAAREGTETGVVEKEETLPQANKKKRSPWPFIVAGAVIVGVVVYFAFIRKPRYALTVETGAGVSGAPAAGRSVHKKGERIAYNFLPADGYKELTVTLDGSAAPASGTVVMDRDHVLRATAASMAEHTLVVVMRSGVSGFPATGTFAFREDETVTYQYSSAEGAVLVKLDGDSVGRSGTFPMDRDRRLEAFLEPVPDLRGTWSFRLRKNGTEPAQPRMLIAFSGKKKSGATRMLEDPAGEYWRDWIGAEGVYEITAEGKLNMDIWHRDNRSYDFYSDSLAPNEFSGTYALNSESDPSSIYERGTWTATRVE